MLKGFSILFLILSVLNIPIYMLLADATKNNEYLNINKSFSYMTIGNLGQDSDTCGSIPIQLFNQD